MTRMGLGLSGLGRDRGVLALCRDREHPVATDFRVASSMRAKKSSASTTERVVHTIERSVHAL